MTSQVNLLHNRQASNESDANELVKASYLLQSESKDNDREQNIDIKTGVRTVIRQNGRCLRDRSVNQLHGYQPGSGIVRGRKKVLISPSQHRGKSWCKAVSGLDLSRSLTCTPSYRLLPMKYIRTSNHLHPLRAEVLNDHWVCVPSSSQDYCLKRVEMSDFEEKMQQCEDDRCEVDVLLECTRAAIRRMEDLMIRLQSSKEVHVDDYLTVIDWRCCERLHVEHGIECEQMIRNDPQTALPMVIGKLKQKQDELVIIREGLDNCWKEVYQNKKEEPSEKGNRRASAVQSRQGKSLTRRKKR